MSQIAIRRALISVFDKNNVVNLAQKLSEKGVEIYSTGGTAKALREAGIEILGVETVTGQAEILGGRVKSLHPVIHGGILARRDLETDMELLARDEIEPIDLVVVNLYPFEATIQAEPDNVAKAIENIDIGGPTMIRSAAKNHPHVVVMTDPNDYDELLAEMDQNNGFVSQTFAGRMAVKAFQTTASYDSAIQEYFKHAYNTELNPERTSIAGTKMQDLRYGENPQQHAAFYRSATPWGLSAIQQLQGKELSYNNILDLDGALRCVLEFDEPAAVIVKHTTPCGVAIADSIHAAYCDAREVDPVSAFGSVIALNRTLDEATATEMVSTFVEGVLCPAAEPAAIEIMQQKKNIRLCILDPWPNGMKAQTEVRSVAGGFLVQDTDLGSISDDEWKIVTKREPTPEEIIALKFAWRVVKHVKSNAIVYADHRKVLGIGAGQMSRVDSSELAVKKSRFDLKGSVIASDAFFPFRDGVDAAAAAGAMAAIQPGGSIRDEEVIEAANEHNMSMVFTGMRHFRH